LDYPGKGNYTPGVSISFPVSKTAMLNVSGFITKGATNTTATQSLDLFGTTYASGDLLTADYKIKNFKLSLQDLLYPFPHMNGQKWHVKTLWEVQYVNMSTSILAPLAPTTVSGSAVATSSTGSRTIIYPTFGLAGEYHLTRNLELQADASGFLIPSHSTIGDAEGSINYRLGSVELVIGDKLFHFKTSIKTAEYFRTTLQGPYAALRWYPHKIPIPCLFCSRTSATTATNEGTSSSPSGGGVAPNAGGTSSSSSAKSDQANFVRRISGGLSLSVLGLSALKNATSTVNNTATVSTEYDTVGASQRIGYGVTGQVVLTDHFAIAVAGLVRRIGYQFTTTVTTTTNTLVSGIVTPVSTSTSTHEDTRANLIDIPAVLRYYNLSRHTRGTRWFVEGGGAFRDVATIRTSLSSTDSGGTVTCCTTNQPVKPARSNAHGLVGGAGAVFIDPFGIHVVPEVQYTRWMNSIFNSFTTDTQKNELAAGFSLTF